MTYLDDVVIGERTELGRHTFTAEEIKAFATLYDPQPFHLDEEAAKRSHFGGLVASGWHTAAMWMHFLVTYRQRVVEDLKARGQPVGRWGPSPGFRDLKWLKPVFAGDTITFATEPAEIRFSQSRPGWGLLFSYNTGTDQHGVLVYSFRSSGFVERRP